MAPRRAVLVIAGLLLLSTAPTARGGESSHRYADGEEVTLWVNKVGPYNNPQETYNYYYLPYCKPRPEQRDEHAWGGLGEVLQGNELINSQLDLKFKVPVPRTHVCSQALSPADVADFAYAVQRHYWYELFLDGLPVWGFVGELREPHAAAGSGSAADGAAVAGTVSGSGGEVWVYTHKQLDISYNGDRIIHVNLTSSDPVQVRDGGSLAFSYAVNWLPSETPFAERFERYLDYSFFEHKIHWFSIFNSFMMVLLLTGLVIIILMRTLRRDYARYAKEEGDLESLERDLSEESGWKLVHGDVFRPPGRAMLLAAAVGTGTQLCLLAVAVILLTIMGTFYEERGTILTAFIVCYALTSALGGYVSGGLFARMEGRAWIQAMLLTACLYPGVIFSIGAVLNTIAIGYGSLAAVPFGYILIVLLLWAFLSLPLCVAGTLLGRNWGSAPNNPCRVKRIPSPIPPRPWYLSPAAIVAAGGLLPFGSIFIEMYFVFTSFFNYKVYYVYGFMLLVLLILLVVTMCVTVVGTYLLLNAENYLWQWPAFGMAASTGGYVFAYSVHYFVFKTHMTGLLQTAFYFGYTAMFCVGLGLMTGSVGYAGAAAFVRTIYRNVKCD